MSSFRDRVTLFSFILTVLVVLVHAVSPDMAALRADQGLIAAYYLQLFLGTMVGGVAVPGFFCISGYLFFRALGVDGDISVARLILAKWRRRVRTLLVPFVLWNLIYYAVYLAAGRAGLSLGEAAAAIIDYRYNPVFWYLRELIVLTLLAPVIWLVIRRRGRALVALVALFFLAVFYEYLPLHIVNEDALFYYCVGAVAATWYSDTVEGKGYEGRRLHGRRDFYFRYFLYGNEGVAGCLGGVIWVAAQYLTYEGSFARFVVIGASIAGRIGGVIFIYFLVGALMAIYDASEAATIRRYRMHAEARRAAMSRTHGEDGVAAMSGAGALTQDSRETEARRADLDAPGHADTLPLPWFTHYNFFVYAVHYLVIRAARLALASLGAPVLAVETLGYLACWAVSLAVALALGRAASTLAPPAYRILTGSR